MSATKLRKALRNQSLRIGTRKRRKRRKPNSTLLPNQRAQRKLASAQRGLKRALTRLRNAARSVESWKKKVRFYDRPEFWDKRTIVAKWKRALGVTPNPDPKSFDFETAAREAIGDNSIAVDRSQCQERFCTCHDDSAWADPLSYQFGCSRCECRRAITKGA